MSNAIDNDMTAAELHALITSAPKGPNALDIITQRAEARLAQRDETPAPAPSTTTATPLLPTLHETYTKPLPVTCFVSIKPDNVLVMPLKKPQKKGELYTSSKDEPTHPAGATCYVVLAVGETSNTPEVATFLPVEPSQIVLARNMILEPLCEAQEPLLLHRSGVLAIIELADVKFTTTKE